MKIEDNLLAVTNCIFRDKKNWVFVSDEQKQKFFFIVNRLLSKKYPDISQLLNQKNINQVVGMDLIFEFMKDKPYPNWFWSKDNKSKQSDILEIEMELLRTKTGLKSEEIQFLMKNYPNECQEEIKYFKNLEKK